MERKQWFLNRFPRVSLNALSFRTFSNAEVEELSVLKVLTPLTFDNLGHPLPGGLYDSKLGSNDASPLCGTCSNYSSLCPGHVGHIELPLPVINPMYRKMITSILLSSCLSCHVILLGPVSKALFQAECKLLDQGLVLQACDLADAFAAKSAWTRIDHSSETTEVIIKDINNRLDSYLKENALLSNHVAEAKGTAFHRPVMTKAALSTVLKSKKCPYCKNPWKTVVVIQNKLFKSTPDVEVAPKFAHKENMSPTKPGTRSQASLTPKECQSHMRELWENESNFLEALFPILSVSTEKHPTDIFFMRNVLVTPTNMRPINLVNGVLLEHPQNVGYKAILNNCLLGCTLIHLIKNKGAKDDILSQHRIELLSKVRGDNYVEKLDRVWLDLQASVDLLVDSDKITKSDTIGLKQILEKKEGIIRMHMMGKRVNYSARSVITPDPNISIDEIGVPDTFAKKLTFPVPVTPWNVTDLRKKVINGPKGYPGANFLINDDGVMIKLDPENIKQRESVAKKLLTRTNPNGVKVLYRHLVNGDVLLINRQPTLHRPSIMAHRARVLTGEKTLRLHYANCKSYNADFDGDEMNAHFPQNEVARSEAYNLVAVGEQYLVPKDGTPLSGLIQDHVVSGVRMTVRDKFFTRGEYLQLAYQGLSFLGGDVKVLPPSMLKPCRLWTGKQLVSTIILNVLPKNQAQMNLLSKSKIPEKAWNNNATGIVMTEAEVVVRQSELLCGVLDKNHYGASPYSLVHCVNELYGGRTAITLLSAFSRLFTAFLQYEGFTLGVKDILTLPQGDRSRKKLIRSLRHMGPIAVSNALDCEPTEVSPERLSQAQAKDVVFRAVLDCEYKRTLDPYINRINRCSMEKLLTRFPENNLQLMISSGAKGSMVNSMQISSLLGQIELEGKRPPIMISGRSLPSFCPYEMSPRSGGFIDGRFMTGIKPQEFFFHCMAGREGLIDTAVKTSRSGYLQRCLIKHLEGLSVGYDLTVRDSDQSVIQFLYGEDGLDISKSKFLNPSQIPFLIQNCASSDVAPQEDPKVKSHRKLLKKWENTPKTKARQRPFVRFSAENCFGKKTSTTNGRSREALKCCKKWRALSSQEKEWFLEPRQPDPLLSKFQADTHCGSISEKLDSIIEEYVKKYGGGNKVRRLMYTRCVRSVCEPGEPVGLLAAQSIGEPSTQMTLNTFHFAGRGEMNVTLGIPRLRELLMVASKHIKTPSMEVPLLPHIPKSEVENIIMHLNRISLADVLENVTVTEQYQMKPYIQQTYTLKFKFLRQEQLQEITHLKPSKIFKLFEKKFLQILICNIARKQKKIVTVITSNDGTKERQEPEEDDDGEPAPSSKNPKRRVDLGENYNSSDEEGGEADDEDASAANRRSKQTEDHQYSDMEDMEDERLVKEMQKQEEEEEEEEVVEEEGLDDKEGQDKASVVADYSNVQQYRYDNKKYRWCEITLAYSSGLERVDFLCLLKDLATKFILNQVVGVKKGFLSERMGDGMWLKTDGLNMLEMFRRANQVDINRLYSNDVHAVAETYGIEAAARVLITEIQNVFRVYGIEVDRRHLSLVSDYMTWDGVYRPLNRKGMEGCSSPLQLMSYESTMLFLKSSVVRRCTETLSSPSARLAVGLPCRVGTASFDVASSITHWTQLSS